MLSRIKIQQFKRIAKFEEDLEPVTVLVGTNNSGKTSVLHAIHSAVGIAQSRLRLSDQVSMRGDETSFSISAYDAIYLPLVDTSWLATNGKLTQTNGPTITFHFNDQFVSEGSVEIKRGKNRNLSVSVKGREVITKIENINKPFSIYVPGLAGITKFESFVARGNLVRSIARGDSNLVLRNVLYLLSQSNESWEAFGVALREVYPGRYIVVRFNPQSDEFISVFVKHGTREMPLDCVGAGFLQTAQILSYIFLFNPAVSLLDEPDSHLHPNNQRVLSTLLCRLSSEGRTRVIMATHSRHILDALHDKEGVKILWMRGGNTQAVSEHIEVLSDLGALDSAEGLIGQGIEFVILTEDQNKKLISLLFEANGAESGKFQVWAYKGCSKIDVAEALGKFIHEVSPQTKIIVHRDADFMGDDDKAFWKNEFKRFQLDLFLTPTPDVEGLLCRVEHIQTLNPGFDAEIQTAFDEALSSNESALRTAARQGRNNVDDIRHKSGRPTEGKDAINAWASSLDLSSERWRHGKKFLSAIRGKFQEKTGVTLKAETSSQHLVIPELQKWIETTKPTTNKSSQVQNQ